MYYFEKVARNIDKESNKEKIQTAGTAVAGAKMIHSSKDRVLGQKTLYHGTSSKNWESIKKEGIKANRGGQGASSLIDNKGYIENSQNKVHLTGSKIKARMYAGLDKATESMKGTPEMQRFSELKKKHIAPGQTQPSFTSYSDMEEYNKANQAYAKKLFSESLKRKNQGKLMKVKMGYDKYKKMEIDPDEAGGVIMREFGDGIKSKKGKALLESIAKHQASRGSFDIGKDEIVGLHKTSKRLKNTAKNLPDYIKNNKGRFGSGVAMATLGTAMIGNSIKRGKNQSEKKASVYLDEICKEAN